MRHRVKTQRLSRNMGARKALLRHLVKALLINQRIKTRPALAKELRRIVEPLITLGKKGDLSARRAANKVLNDRRLVKLLFDKVAPKFTDRNGGYTRIYKLCSYRRGDGADLCIIELTEFYQEPQKIELETDKQQDSAPKRGLTGLRALFRRQRSKDKKESK